MATKPFATYLAEKVAEAEALGIVAGVPAGLDVATEAEAEALVAVVQADIDAHEAQAADAHDASAVSFTPAGTVAATNVQAAIVEVSGDADGTAADLTAHEAETTGAHGLPDPSTILVDADIGGSVASQAAVVAAQSTADGKVAKAGDTMTGTLLLTNTIGAKVEHIAPILEFNETDAPVDGRRWQLREVAGSMWLRSITDAGVEVKLPLTVSHAGAVSMLGASSVTVPAITGANQAARVTGWDPATGRLAIGGKEVGDTGWINVAPSSGWTTTRLRYRRLGMIVAVDFAGLDANPATGFTVLVLPSGFRPSVDQTFAVPQSAAVANTAMTTMGAAAAGAVTANHAATWSGGAGVLTFPTTAAWPATI